MGRRTMGRDRTTGLNLRSIALFQFVATVNHKHVSLIDNLVVPFRLRQSCMRNIALDTKSTLHPHLPLLEQGHVHRVQLQDRYMGILFVRNGVRVGRGKSCSILHQAWRERV